MTSLGLLWPSARSSKSERRALVKRRARDSEAARRHAQHQRHACLSARFAAALRPLPSGRILVSRDWLNAFIFRQPAAGPWSFLLVCLCESHRLISTLADQPPPQRITATFVGNMLVLILRNSSSTAP
jgi:hypothetical protein